MQNQLTTSVVLFVFLVTGMAEAQEKLPISEILPQLLGNTIILEPTSLPDQPNHQAHFKPGFDQLEVPGQFNRALLTLLSTYPVGSPSGGFTYTFDPALGTFRRTSESFGPIFAERALTIGRDRVSVGFAYQHASYDTFEGINLRQRDVKFYVPHIDCCSRGGGPVAQSDGSRLTPAFEGDLVRAELALRLTTDANVLVVNYGVHDRFDVGVTVPFVRVSMDASVLATIERLSTETEPEIHHFPVDRSRQQTCSTRPAAQPGSATRRPKQVCVPAASGRWSGGRRRSSTAYRRRNESARHRRSPGARVRHRIPDARPVFAAHQRRLHVLDARRAARHERSRRDKRRGRLRPGCDATRDLRGGFPRPHAPRCGASARSAIGSSSYSKAVPAAVAEVEAAVPEEVVVAEVPDRQSKRC